MFIRYCR